jgi:GTPase
VGEADSPYLTSLPSLLSCPSYTLGLLYIFKGNIVKFVDEVVLRLKAGDGGSGSKHFRREKFVPRGGPDGGDGGNGGSIIFIGDESKRTLLDFRYRPEWKAKAGSPGGGQLKTGKCGENVYLHVPLGTEVIYEENGELLSDICEPGEPVVICKGGRGGKGNNFFKSPTNQTPEHFQPGQPGEEKTIRLSLKLLADVGILGFPNAGKSTLISTISAARPKVADYPFTTLVPQLGVVKTPAQSLVLADIPGLIPGAHNGKGLGISFLKHIERTAAFLHLIELSAAFMQDEVDPADYIADRYHEIRDELAKYSPELLERPELVVLSKADVIQEINLREIIEKVSERVGKTPIYISSITKIGVGELLKHLDHLTLAS